MAFLFFYAIKKKISGIISQLLGEDGSALQTEAGDNIIL